MIGTANRNIIVVPCIVKIWLYRSGPMRRLSGRASCARIAAASRPARMKKQKPVTMKRLPIDLWLMAASQPSNPGGSLHVRSSAAASSAVGGTLFRRGPVVARAVIVT